MSEEPQFFRLLFPSFPRSPWALEYSCNADGVHAALTADKCKAQIFITPAPADLERIRKALGPVTLEPATFAEWIEQDTAAHAAKKS